ncbi:Neuropeptide FF receptor 2 [Branchiostoma belcheri]|nr:Neuropeptide FF receptor 2 [Branchiostoma belcheri]
MDLNDINITNITDTSVGLMDYMLKQTVPIITVLGISYFLTFASSIIGNILVILVVLKIPRMRTVTNYFILNLAVSDILVAIFCMPFTLVDNIIRGWIFGDVMCKLSPAVQVVSVSASLFTLVGIAFDRFFAIVHPTKHAINIRSTLYVIITVWASAICVMIPQVANLRRRPTHLDIRLPKRTHIEGDVLVPVGMLAASYRMIWLRSRSALTSQPALRCSRPPAEDNCQDRALVYEGIVVMHVCEETNKMWRKVYTLVLFVICYIGPLTIIMYLYARIGHKVWFKPSPGGGFKSLVLGKSEGPLGNNVMTTPNHEANGETPKRVIAISSSPNMKHTEV